MRASGGVPVVQPAPDAALCCVMSDGLLEDCLFYWQPASQSIDAMALMTLATACRSC